MKRYSTRAVLAIGALSLTFQAFAGNKDRTGQAGATELLINPWGQSTGVFGMNTADVQGIEAMKGNIAGLAYVENLEVGAAYSVYLRGSQVSVNNLGIGKRLGTFGVLGVNLQSMGFGDIDITNYNNPTAGVGTFKPQFFNLQLGFAKEFSHAIHAGIGGTFVSEQITNVRASGACFEAGVQYVTGAQDNFHFGVTLRNIGTNMRYTGEGFSINSEAPEDATYQINRQTPAEKFEMPTYLNIGVAYDFLLDAKHLQKESDKPKHRLTAMASFTSNSFNNDYLGLGLEYAFHDMFMLRGAYRYETGIGNAETSTTFYTGFAAGASVKFRLGGSGPDLAIDYSFRPTQRPDNGVHTFGLRLMTHSKRAAAASDAQD